MKHKLLLLLVAAAGVAFFAPQAGNGKFQDAPFSDSYMAHMRRMTGSGMAEMRAEDARGYLICDADHHCQPAEQPADGIKKSPRSSFCWIRDVGSYPHVCVW